MHFVDDRVAEAKRKGMEQVMQLLDLTGLKRAGAEWVGPCPVCGGTDRFAINTRKGQFLCRRCDAKGDEIGLVMHVMGFDFKAALDWLCGPRQEISDEERARRAKLDAENQRQRDAAALRHRQYAINDARKIWEAGLSAEDSPVRDYLLARGITREALPVMPASLRFAPELPYVVERARHGGRRVFETIYRGPAMLAGVQGADNRFCAVHRTWFDLTKPQGKAVIIDPATGEQMARKKILGSKKGGAIRLKRGAQLCGDMVMGEGIETTLTAAVAGVWPAAHFWAGVDLGNMSGQRKSGKGLKYAGLPDMADMTAFLPPEWVRLLVYVKDGDSDPRDTQSKLEAGLRRAMMMRPLLRGQIVACPEGVDLNDLLLGVVPKGEDQP
jgi:hypothetical protein